MDSKQLIAFAVFLLFISSTIAASICVDGICEEELSKKATVAYKDDPLYNAKLYFFDKKYRESAIEIENFLKKNPKSEEGVILLSKVYGTLGDFQSAYLVLKKAENQTENIRKELWDVYINDMLPSFNTNKILKTQGNLFEEISELLLSFEDLPKRVGRGGVNILYNNNYRNQSLIIAEKLIDKFQDDEDYVIYMKFLILQYYLEERRWENFRNYLTLLESSHQNITEYAFFKEMKILWDIKTEFFTPAFPSPEDPKYDVKKARDVTVCGCALDKNIDGKILEQFIRYHLLLKVDFVALYINEELYKENEVMLKAFSSDKRVQIRRKEKENLLCGNVWNECVMEHRDDSRWIAALEARDFLAINELTVNTSLAEFLEKYIRYESLFVGIEHHCSFHHSFHDVTMFEIFPHTLGATIEHTARTGRLIVNTIESVVYDGFDECRSTTSSVSDTPTPLEENCAIQSNYWSFERRGKTFYNPFLGVLPTIDEDGYFVMREYLLPFAVNKIKIARFELKSLVACRDPKECLAESYCTYREPNTQFQVSPKVLEQLKSEVTLKHSGTYCNNRGECVGYELPPYLLERAIGDLTNIALMNEVQALYQQQPNNVVLAKVLMDMKEANGDHNKAISLVQQILVAAPQFSACYEYLLNYGSNEEIKSTLAKIKDELDLESMKMILDVIVQRGWTDESFQLLSEIAKLEETPSFQTYYGYGIVNLVQKNEEDAMLFLKKSIEVWGKSWFEAELVDSDDEFYCPTTRRLVYDYATELKEKKLSNLKTIFEYVPNASQLWFGTTPKIPASSKVSFPRIHIEEIAEKKVTFYSLSNVRMHGNFIIQDNCHLYLSGLNHLVQSPKKFYVEPDLPIKSLGRVFILPSQRIKNNYYHTLIESFTELSVFLDYRARIVNFKEVVLLIDTESTMFRKLQSELVPYPPSLTIVDYEPSKYIYEIEELMFAESGYAVKSVLTDFLSVWEQPKWALIRSRAKYTPEYYYPFMVVYCTRRDTEFRQVRNEGILIRKLREEFGKENVIVHSSSATLNETRTMFNVAKVVIGPHGAGLSNMIFASPAASLIEFPTKTPHLQRMFAYLSAALNFPYYVIPDLQMDYWGADAIMTDELADLVVDVAREAFDSVPKKTNFLA